MKALILTGGKGTRLRPYTSVLPKPLVPVGDRPILEIVLRQLKKNGITEVILAVNYMYQLIEAVFRDGSSIGMNIRYSHEDKPLGTAGPIANVIDDLGDDFLVMNGDLLTDLDFGDLCKKHIQEKNDATIAVTKRDVKIDYGVLEINEQNLLSRYIEKPEYRYYVSMGINVLKKESVRPFLKKGEPLDIPSLMTKLNENGKKVGCVKSDALWIDIGRKEDYELANDVFSEKFEPTLGLTAKPTES